MHLRAEHRVILEREVVVAYPGWPVLAAGAGALVRRRERRVPAQFGGGSLIVVEGSRPRRPHRHPSTTEIVDPAESAAEHAAAGRMGLHEAMGRGEKGRAVVLLREDVSGFESGRPEGGRGRLIRRRRLVHCEYRRDSGENDSSREPVRIFLRVERGSASSRMTRQEGCKKQAKPVNL